MKLQLERKSFKVKDEGRKTKSAECERQTGKGERNTNDKVGRALARIRGSEHERVRDGVRSGMTLFAFVTSLAIAESNERLEDAAACVTWR